MRRKGRKVKGTSSSPFFFPPLPPLLSLVIIPQHPDGSQRNLPESVLSYHCVGSGNETQVLRLESNSLCPLNRHTDLKYFCYLICEDWIKSQVQKMGTLENIIHNSDMQDVWDQKEETVDREVRAGSTDWQSRVWGDSSAAKVITTAAWEPKFRSSTPRLKLGMEDCSSQESIQ